MHFCNRRMNELQDPDLDALVNELANVRLDRFAHGMSASSLLTFLTAFFLPDDGRRFAAIRPDELSCDNEILTRRIRDFHGIPIPTLLEELADAGNTHWDNHAAQKLYVALNFLLRPICVPKKKAQPLSPRKRLEIRQRRNREY